MVVALVITALVLKAEDLETAFALRRLVNSSSNESDDPSVEEGGRTYTEPPPCHSGLIALDEKHSSAGSYRAVEPELPHRTGDRG